MNTRSVFIVLILSAATSLLHAQGAPDAVSAATGAEAAPTGPSAAAPAAAPDAVSSASIPEAPSGPLALKFHFMGDFDVEASAAGDFSGTPTFTFRQNHQALLIQATGGSEISILADVFHPADLFELGIALGATRLTAGRILVPFGEFGFHHLYGGRQDDSGIFLPKLWSDFGIAISFPLGKGLEMEVYAVNGFDPAGFGSTTSPPRFYSFAGIDNNLAKALGARLRYDPSPASRLSASLYQDFYGESLDKSITMAGVDGSLQWGKLGLKGGAAFGAIRGPGFSGFYRWSDYAEAKWNFSKPFAIRLRLGSMDPDTRVSNGEDQNNANIALVWRFDHVEYDLTYFRNFSGTSFAADPVVSDRHQLLFKILLTL
jgi:hypothetical protein